MSGVVIHERGDVLLILGDRRVHLRPTFAALAAIEQARAPLMTLVHEASEGRPTLSDMALVFHHCWLLDKGDERPAIEAIGEMIVAAGLMAPLHSYRALLAAILGGHDADKG
ncbi:MULTISPECIES: GTA-gp10 family protein [unclassified Iodidimonas]|jgi:hypothetical protein|uniref:GTA-gp10 family protein n=1 Tax=unclassified Iodidimonas TaxID=2626145 RepID=UPI00248324BE|nr:MULTISPECIES: GTA-gp10 family protein [unclassified Iodidimonas]